MMKLFQMSSFLILIISTFISISASSWVGAWVGLEINLLSIMPILILTKNMKSSEASIKYFITQIIASIVLLAFILLMMMNFPNSFYGNPPPYLGIMGALMLKMGAAPLHFWLPSVMEGLTWPSCMIIMTWQKITPMILLSFISKFNIFILMFIVMSSLIGAIGGFNQTNLKKIMAFSSINHISWMIIAITLNEITWMVYFLSYCLISLSIVMLFMIQGNSQINQLWNSMNKSFFSKIVISASLLSLGGLPPFLGFLPKWIIISKLINSQFLLVIILIMSSLVTLFFYIRIIFSSMSMNSLSSLTQKYLIKNSFMFSSSLFISLSTFILVPLFINLT